MSRCCRTPPPPLLFLLFLRFNEPASGNFWFKAARTARTARSPGRQSGGPRGAGSVEQPSTRDADGKAVIPDGFGFDDLNKSVEVETVGV